MQQMEAEYGEEMMEGEGYYQEVDEQQM